jgi:multidrug efflux pump subunit AcrA (membrane-fusion protein)
MAVVRVGRKGIRRRVLLAAVSCAAMSIIIARWMGETMAVAADNPSTAPAVAPATATTGPTTQPAGAVVAIAAVEAFWSADQYAKSSGYVSDVKADIGDRVKKGQVLAVLDVPELDKELAAARATLVAKREMAKAAIAATEQAQTALDVAKRLAAGAQAEQHLADATLKRQEELFADKAATEQQMDEVRAKTLVARATTGVAEAKIAAAEADLKAARANQAVAKANADVAAAEAERTEAMTAYTRITAPFDGVVTRRQVSPGDLVQAATASRTSPMFTVQRIDTVRVFCDIPEASVGAVRVGVPAEVKLYGSGGVVIRGTVTRVAAAVNPGTRTMRAEIDLPNPDEKLRPGMYAQVTLFPSVSPVAAVPPAR